MNKQSKVCLCTLVILSACAPTPESKEQEAPLTPVAFTSVDGSTSIELKGDWTIEQEDDRTMVAKHAESGAALWLTTRRVPYTKTIKQLLTDLDESDHPVVMTTDKGYMSVGFVPKDQKGEQWLHAFNYIAIPKDNEILLAEFQFYHDKAWVFNTSPHYDLWRGTNSAIYDVTMQ